jgi:hypothetical protein
MVEYQLTATEAARAMRWQVLRLRRTYLAPTFGGSLIAMGIAFLIYPGVSSKDITGVAALVIGAFLVAEFAYLVWMRPKRFWSRHEGVRVPQTLVASDEGIQTRSVISESRSQWGVLKATFENDYCYMVQAADRRENIVAPKRRAYFAVPKRAFGSAEDELRFRQLVERHTESHLWSPDHM